MPTETETYEYFAFISYSHKDKEFAHELQRYLEEFRLPTTLCEQYPKTRRDLNPLFRDMNNLVAGQLDDKLKEALAASHYLIVISSENSAQRNEDDRCYVNEEVFHFLFLSDNPEEKLRHIIPVIYRTHEGIDARMCLPPLLRLLKVLGIDLLEHGRELCFCKVAATMLGLDPQVLLHHLQRQRRPHLPYTRYYADYVECHDMPVGIGELSEEEAARRRYHYRITYRHERPRLLLCCNSAGTPVKPELPWLAERPVGMKLEYNDEGKIIRQIYLDRHGRESLACLTHGRSIEFRAVGFGGFRTLSHLKHSNRLLLKQGATNAITGLSLTRDSAGHIITEMFRNVEMMPVQDQNGIWGRRYRRDTHGRILSVEYLDRNGKPHPNREGMAGYAFTYGEGGLQEGITHICYSMAAGAAPAAGGQHCASAAAICHEGGNIASICYRDAEGNLCPNAEGITRAAFRYDERGNCVEESYFGADGARSRNREGIAAKAMEYDELGRCIRESCLDTALQPCRSAEGYAVVTYGYDEHHHQTRREFFDELGQRCRNVENVSVLELTYNEEGKLTHQAFFGEDGEPCLHVDGFSSGIAVYDENGNFIEAAYFGVKGEPALDRGLYHRRIRSYDTRGNLIRQIHEGTDGKPCLLSDGYSGFTLSYGEGGWVTEGYLGIDGMPCMHRDGYARCARLFDSNGNTMEERYLSMDGNPCLCKEGYARLTRRYDEEGTITEEKRFGLDGCPL